LERPRLFTKSRNFKEFRILPIHKDGNILRKTGREGKGQNQPFEVEEKTMERLLTPREAAKIVAVTPRTIKEWLRRGDLAGIKIQHMWRLRASDLEKFIEQGSAEDRND
jgi:excisionase family DNA binding protein